MYISPISTNFSVYNLKHSKLDKPQTQPSFKNNLYRELANKMAEGPLEEFIDYSKIFWILLNKAKSSAGAYLHPKVRSGELLSLSGSIGEKLREAKRLYKDDRIGWDESLILKGNKPLVSMNSWGGITFYDVSAGNFSEDKIMFYLDNKGDFVLETDYTETRFYDSTKNLKLQRKHPSDYSGAKTTYYHEDGSENFFKNFFLG